MPDQIRVLIADDHAIVRTGLHLLLEEQPDIDVVGEAIDGQEAVTQTEALLPDLVLMDISMPGIDGLEATRQIKAKFPQTEILILTMHRSDDYLFEALKAGASGYLIKGAKASELIDAVRVVGKGEVFLYPTMAQKLVKGYLTLVEWEDETQVPISPREKKVLRLIADGFSNNEIAEKLTISLSTVHSHRRNIMQKLGLSNRRELIQYAQRRGLIKND